MCELMYPKTMGMKKKQRQKHPKSIIDTRPGECFLCKLMGRQYYKQTEEHHVFYGNGDRTNKSEKHGFKVYLCPECHRRAPYAAHNSDATRQLLCTTIKMKYLETHTEEEWESLNIKNPIPQIEYVIYRDLKRGDFVRYYDVLKDQNGIGEVFGFVDQENTVIVWVQNGGAFISVPLDYVEKIL